MSKMTFQINNLKTQYPSFNIAMRAAKSMFPGRTWTEGNDANGNYRGYGRTENEADDVVVVKRGDGKSFLK